MNGIVNKKIGIAAIGITILVVLIGAIFVISTKGNNEVDLATTNTETNENNDTETVVTNDTIKNKEVENNTTKVASANVVNDTKNTTTNKTTSTTSTGSNKNNTVVNKSNTTTTNKNTSTNNTTTTKKPTTSTTNTNKTNTSKPSTTTNKTTSTSSIKNTTTTKPSTNNTTKKPTTTTTTKKHVHNGVGTMGWFNSYDELVAAYKAENNKWNALWKADKISDEEFARNCPIGYTNTHGCFAYIMHESDHDCGLVTGDWIYRNK